MKKIRGLIIDYDKNHIEERLAACEKHIIYWKKRKAAIKKRFKEISRNEAA